MGEVGWSVEGQVPRIQAVGREARQRKSIGRGGPACVSPLAPLQPLVLEVFKKCRL